MIDRFVKGNWYVYRGTGRGPIWNREGLMDGVLDNRPHRCTTADAWARNHAAFDVAPRGEDATWNWGDLSLWFLANGPQEDLL